MSLSHLVPEDETLVVKGLMMAHEHTKHMVEFLEAHLPDALDESFYAEKYISDLATYKLEAVKYELLLEKLALK